MRFSIVIPVFNVEQYLRDCLNSVLHQTCEDWEAVCVDDGSTDGSNAILNEYAARDERIKVFRQPNAGLSAARNTGLRAASGDYILFLDSDDWLEPRTLEIIKKNLAPINSDTLPLDMLCFGGWQGDKMEMPVEEVPINGWDYYNRNALGHHDFPFVCVVLRCYRRQFLIENSLDFKEGILHEDNHFTPRACLRAQSVSVIPEPLYHYRMRNGSIMKTRGLRNKESLVLIGNELSVMYAKEEGIDRTVVYQALTQYYQMAFIDNTREEDSYLSSIILWSAYRRVSRTKMRHRVNYVLIRLMPSLFRYFSTN